MSVTYRSLDALHRAYILEGGKTLFDPSNEFTSGMYDWMELISPASICERGKRELLSNPVIASLLGRLILLPSVRKIQLFPAAFILVFDCDKPVASFVEHDKAVMVIVSSILSLRAAA